MYYELNRLKKLKMDKIGLKSGEIAKNRMKSRKIAISGPIVLD